MDGDPWHPLSEKADLAFSNKWCVHCLELSEAEPWEDEFGTEQVGSCAIMNMAVWGEKPHQLRIRNGEPICTAFRDDPAYPIRCPHTLELFP